MLFGPGTHKKLAGAVIAASGILTATVVAPAASAADLSPADVQGDATPATLSQTPPDGEELVWRQKVDAAGDRVQEMWAYSPSMDRQIPLVVITPEQDAGPRPTIYLLNGGDGGEGRANWIMQTDVLDFYLDKNVNVVIPMEGKFSYYIDWLEDEPALGGAQKWETFLVRELPGPLEQHLGANGQRAVAGMSMSATTSLLFPQHFPGFYDAAASFSGCAATSDPIGHAFAEITMNNGGITNMEKMWGPMGGETNRYNDALVQSDNLRGTELYISNASGMAGAWDGPDSPRFEGLTPEQKSLAMGETIIVGGVIEGATNKCTHDLKVKLDSAGIPADWNLRNTGTHSWGWWQDDLRGSWETFDRAFNG